MNNEKTPEEIAKEQEAARKAAEQAAAGAQPKTEAKPAEPAKAAPAAAVTVVVNDKPWYASNVAITCYCVAGAAVLAAGAYFLLNAIYGDKDAAETAE